MKEITYQIENTFLSPFAVKSEQTRGRAREETPCPMRTDFQRDRDRIIHSKAFRRLKNKTQVFLSPEGDHFRTRLSHTLDVSQIARSIARSLRLNEDLTEAISLGHDLGHTPFGHSGERVLNRLSGGAFSHAEQSVRVVDKLEKNGAGLNLTFEVRDGILHHQKSGTPATLEGKAVSFADRIAYLNHDIDDAIRAGIIKRSDLPASTFKVLGESSSARINSMIWAIYRVSEGKPIVEMEQEVLCAMDELRDFMFRSVYITPASMAEEEKANRMLEAMFNYFRAAPEKLPPFFYEIAKEEGETRAICDYLSSMSDRYAEYVFSSLFIPKSWSL
ncbi:MAG: deoxyguanosinetriphosphate triphosphohydrolase [Clostridia bacterium]|nr:deoxyguanosinetriphosphate triphosphohydrolase [Clostridia bacterium]